MFLPVVALLLSGQSMIRPPMHRAWTVLSGDNTELRGVRGPVLYYSAQCGVGAVRIDTGARVWDKRLSDWCGGAAMGEHRLFVLDAGGKSTRLVAYDLRTGASYLLKSYPEGTREIACDGRRIYVLSKLTVDACDVKTGKTIWQKKLGSSPTRGLTLSSLTTGNSRVFAAIESAGFHCLDSATGKLLWRDNGQHGVYNPPIIVPGGIVTGFKGLRLQNVSTGKPVWTAATEYFQAKAIAGNVLIGEDMNRLCGIDLKTGKRLWQGPPPKEDGIRVGGNEHLAPSVGNSALLLRDDLSLVSATGDVLWRSKVFFTGAPVYVNAGTMICNDGERLFGYGPGDYPPTPDSENSRKDFALRMVASFEKLDKTEVERVGTLARYTTQPLIRKYVEWAIDNREDGPADKQGRGMMLYNLLMDNRELLDGMCSRDDTDALLRAIADVGRDNSYRNELVAILGRKGDPARAMPLFVEELKATGKKRSESAGAMLDAVATSTHPAAVQFMIEALNDAKAPAGWRNAAFIHLAGTGGEAGVDAVRRARARRSARKPWDEQVVVESRDVITDEKDGMGRRWRLINSEELGNHSDVFLQRKSETGWDKPIFLGFFTGRTWTESAPETFRGVGLKALLAKEWLKIFPDDKEIRRDSDGDGLTDLVEARFGTNWVRPTLTRTGSPTA
jgi:hypothetical protein